jgi:hypothetical protein
MQRDIHENFERKSFFIFLFSSKPKNVFLVGSISTEGRENSEKKSRKPVKKEEERKQLPKCTYSTVLARVHRLIKKAVNRWLH